MITCLPTSVNFQGAELAIPTKERKTGQPEGKLRGPEAKLDGECSMQAEQGLPSFNSIAG